MTNNNSKRVKILGIVGSPRQGGNTDLLVDKVLEGTTCCGAITNKIYLSKLAIAPCKACLGCQKTGRCVVKDDMVGVVDQLESSSVWVLGTPVYFMGPTGWFKAFIDRFYGVREHVDLSKKKVITVIPFEDTNSATARHTVGMINDTMDYLKISTLANIIVPGVMNRGDVSSKPDVLESAYRAGCEVVSQIACSNLLKQNN